MWFFPHRLFDLQPRLFSPIQHPLSQKQQPAGAKRFINDPARLSANSLKRMALQSLSVMRVSL
jgi:hypothetical protein